jgi:tRNA(Ile)-lysidine synthase
LDKLILKVNSTIKKYQMLQPGDTIIVAVSGGPDSLCLLNILKHISGEYGLSLIVAHVNHGIRIKESELEAQFVRSKSSDMNLPFEQLSVSVPVIAKEKSISLEQAGRSARYEFFKKLFKKHKAHKIALGHHADDQVETVLMRIIRGSGLQGLRGIPAKRDVFIRPLIECTRKEIEGYCLRQKISYCFDSSNKEPRYLRNKIRHQLIPLLTSNYNASINSHLLQLQTIVQDELHYWEEQTEEFFQKIIIERDSSGIVLDIKKMIQWPVALQRQIIRKGLRYITEYLDDIQFNHIENIRELCLLERGERYQDLPGNIRVRKSYQKLKISYADYIKIPEKKKKSEIWEYKFSVGEEKIFPKVGIKLITKQYKNIEPVKGKYLNKKSQDEEYFDYNKLEFPLRIRNRRPGDRFKPINSKYYKKIKSYFIDQKIPLHKRDMISLVIDNSNRIVWIVGLQIDDRFKIDKKTKKVLYIRKEDIYLNKNKIANIKEI